MDQPFRTNPHESGLFLVEGVSAVGEIKSRLTKADLSETLKKAAQFKKLRNHHGAGDTRWTNPSDGLRFYECPPYFLFAFESAVATDTLLSELSAAELVVGPDGAQPQLPPLDGVFILGRGVAINYGDGQGALQWRQEDPAGVLTSVPGWVWRDTATVIAEFLIWLGAAAPRVNRANAIAQQYLIRHMKTQGGGGLVHSRRDQGLSQVYRD